MTTATGAIHLIRRTTKIHLTKASRNFLSTESDKISSPKQSFFNPWQDLAQVTEDAALFLKVDTVTRTFSVVGALMCALSAAALAAGPSADDTEDEPPPINHNHVSSTSVLVRWGIPSHKLHDIYTACCAGSFYSSVCGLGLSTVLSAWNAATPVGGSRNFVMRNSWFLVAVPGLLAASTGLAGIGLFIGLDKSKGTPISYIGLGGTILGGGLIGAASIRGWVGTHRLLTPMVNSAKKRS